MRKHVIDYTNSAAFVDTFGAHMSTIYNSAEFQMPITEDMDRRAHNAVNTIPGNQVITDAIAQVILQSCPPTSRPPRAKLPECSKPVRTASPRSSKDLTT